MFQVIIKSNDFITNFLTGFYYDAWNADKCIEESFEFHANYSSANGTIMHQQPIPRF